MSEEYPNAPPWIEIMLEENSLIKAMRLERERAQLERIIQRTKFDFSDETAIPLPATREKPLNDTHALHLLMRGHGNVGFTIQELKRFSDDAGYGLTEKSIRNVYWRQSSPKKGLMEKTPDGKIRLTKKGEQFDRFRVQKMA